MIRTEVLHYKNSSVDYLFDLYLRRYLGDPLGLSPAMTSYKLIYIGAVGR